MKKILFISAIIFSGYLSAQNVSNLDSCLVLQPDPERGIDAEVFSCFQLGYDSLNFGDIQDICATDWTKSGHESIIRSLIYFDLSSVPNAAMVKSAKLTLYHNPNSPEGQHSSLSGSNTSVIQRITSPWSEYDVTWNNHTQNFVDIDVTQLVKDSKNAPQSSYGFLFRQQIEQYYRKLVFASSDYPVDSLRPKLVICFYNTNNLQDISHQMMVDIFPNPTKSILNIILKKNYKDCTVKILNIAGKAVVQQLLNNAETKIDISSLASGFYVVEVRNTNGKIIHKKIVVQ